MFTVEISTYSKLRNSFLNQLTEAYKRTNTVAHGSINNYFKEKYNFNFEMRPGTPQDGGWPVAVLTFDTEEDYLLYVLQNS